MDLDEVRTLLDYHYWARDRVLAAAEHLTPAQFTQSLGNSFTSVRDTLVHLYGAEWVWGARWQGEAPVALPAPDPFPDVASIRHAWLEQEQRVRAVVESLGEAGIARTMEYRGFNGQPQAQPFRQQLQHLVNHGSYHRGQVTTMLRQLGAPAPASMDLIAFYRERQAAAG